MKYFFGGFILVFIAIDAFPSSRMINLNSGDICNFSICSNGLKCLSSLDQRGVEGLKGGGEECGGSSECVSNQCSYVKKNGIRRCENIKRCYPEISVGDNCSLNPNCKNSKCELYDSNTSGLGECSSYGDLCRSDNECCSNACRNNVCVLNYQCKKCSKVNEKIEVSGVCCEGLVENYRRICVPDMPVNILPDI